MNKQDLDALANLYGGVYSAENINEEYLQEAPKPPANDIGYRMGSAIKNTLKDLATGSGKDLKNLVTKGRLENTPERQRIQRGISNFTSSAQNTLNRIGGNSTPRPSAATTRPATTRPAATSGATRPAAPAGSTSGGTRPAGAAGGATRPSTSSGGTVRPAAVKPTPTAPAKPAASAAQTGDKEKDMQTWAKANPTLANKPKTFNPAMQKTFGYQTGYAPNQVKGDINKMANMGSLRGISASYEWPSAKTIRDIAGAYSSIYEAKKKVDQDKDGDNDFADVRIARMIASGKSKEEAIAAVKSKEYNEEFELDEATRMRKELGKEGETAVRKELAARSNAYNRSGSVDKTIAAAERGADRPYVKHKRDESESDRASRERKQSQTLRGLAASRRKSVRDKPRAGMKGYASKVEGSDKDLQSARQRAMSAGTLTPREKKELGEVYEIVASYLLENNFADTLIDANVIIENMSEVWLNEILESVN